MQKLWEKFHQHTLSRCGGRKTFSGLKLVCQWPFHESHQSVFGVSAVAVMKWVRALSERLCPKLEPSQERVLVIGVDEFWHYLKKEQRVWIFKAYDRHRKRLIDWECGDRTAATFERLYKRLSPHNILFYNSDPWRGFNKIIPPQRLYQGKDKTVAIERNNCQYRHWFVRFKRKSIIVSKSLDMIEATMRIFAAVHVNKTLNPKYCLSLAAQ